MNSNITFKDVAKLAGVSTQTVSRVTNNATNVKPETRERVQAAIDELGYVPNQSAQMLVRKKAKVFGVLTLNLSLQGSSRIVEGIRNQSKAAGYAISLAVLDDSDDLDAIIRELRSQQVDAILINAPVEAAIAEQAIKNHPALPFVFIDVDPATPVNQVMTDHHSGALLAANLMVEQQRSRFAFINGPAHSPAAQLRREGWVSVIEAAGAKLVDEETGDWSAKSGYFKTMELLASGRAIDALMVANDQMAIGVLRACRENNISVPDDIAVIGFDDTNNSGYFCPPLTTIRQNFREIGHQAVEEILACLEAPAHKPIKRAIPVELIERQSTAPAKPASEKDDRLTALLTELKPLLP